MSCAPVHARFNFVAVALATATVQHSEGKRIDATPLAMGTAAAMLPSLPDWIEPALHPNHRSTGHSIATFVGLYYGMHRLYKWEAEGEWERLLRIAGLVVGSAYLAHLARDAFTAKTLPLI